MLINSYTDNKQYIYKYVKLLAKPQRQHGPVKIARCEMEVLGSILLFLLIIRELFPSALKFP